MPVTFINSGRFAAPAGDTILAAYHTDWPAWSAADAVSGWTFARLQGTSPLGGGAANRIDSASAVGHSVSYLFDVEAGTYSFNVNYCKFTIFGIWDVIIDSTNLGSIDMYGTLSYNNYTTYTGISLTAGVHTVKLECSGKNASSSSWAMQAAWLSLDRTGA